VGCSKNGPRSPTETTRILPARTRIVHAPTPPPCSLCRVSSASLTPTVSRQCVRKKQLPASVTRSTACLSVIAAHVPEPAAASSHQTTARNEGESWVGPCSRSTHASAAMTVNTVKCPQGASLWDQATPSIPRVAAPAHQVTQLRRLTCPASASSRQAPLAYVVRYRPASTRHITQPAALCRRRPHHVTHPHDTSETGACGSDPSFRHLLSVDRMRYTPVATFARHQCAGGVREAP
jgi:hypothetical protein